MGDVDEENPVPGEVVGDEAAQRGAYDRGHSEHDAQEALELAAFFGREKVGDGDEAVGHYDAAAESLYGAEGYELGHGRAGSGQHGADEEDGYAADEEYLAPVDVGEPADYGDGHGGGDQVGGGDPSVAVEAAQVGYDAGHGGGYDGLVEGGEEHSQQQADHSEYDLPSGELHVVPGYGLVGGVPIRDMSILVHCRPHPQC